jgi:predicted glycosyltransferase
MKFDGRQLLKDTDLFIGSGGTMTAEAALSGVPTISFNAIPNRIEEFLVKRKLVLRETSSKKITKLIDSILSSTNKKNYKNVENVLEKMENPVNVLLKYI